MAPAPTSPPALGQTPQTMSQAPAVSYYGPSQPYGSPVQSTGFQPPYYGNAYPAYPYPMMGPGPLPGYGPMLPPMGNSAPSYWFGR